MDIVRLSLAESPVGVGFYRMMAGSLFAHALLLFLFGSKLIRPVVFQSEPVIQVSLSSLPGPLVDQSPTSPALTSPLSQKVEEIGAEENPEGMEAWWKKQMGKIAPLQEKIKTKGGTEPQPIRKNVRVLPPQQRETSAVAQEEGHPGVIEAVGSESHSGQPFLFPYYLKQVENKISGGWTPPPAGGVRREGPVDVVVRFQVKRDGGIGGVDLERGSGHDFFDRAALRAVYAASPLPPLPRDFSEDRLYVHFRFVLQ